MSPYNWAIYPLTQSQVANQQKKSEEGKKLNFIFYDDVKDLRVGELFS